MTNERDDKLAKVWARILYLENRIAILEDENIGTSNALYEMENRLQSQVDALITYTMAFEPNDVM